MIYIAIAPSASTDYSCVRRVSDAPSEALQYFPLGPARCAAIEGRRLDKGAERLHATCSWELGALPYLSGVWQSSCEEKIRDFAEFCFSLRRLHGAFFLFSLLHPPSNMGLLALNRPDPPDGPNICGVADSE